MPSTNSHPLTIAVLALFLVGAVMFVIGTLIARERAPDVVMEESPARPAPLEGIELRIDTIERMAIVGQPWCVEELQEIRANDPSEMIRNAADDALLVIAARGGAY